jgi:pimeloyl-ACP methyl ester carboxylesterase
VAEARGDPGSIVNADSKRGTVMRRSLLGLSAVALVGATVALLVYGSIASSARPARTPSAGVSRTASTPAAFPPAVAAWRRRNWPALTGRVRLTRTWAIHYRAHDGVRRAALVVLPRWYGPRNHPPIPLVISPHGRGIEPAGNVRLWGNMPALGRFAVVNPEGQGSSRLELYSWGSAGQIDDLARMPAAVKRALPWLRIARHRIYAIGGSMGGQETLLLLAERPHLLSGAISFDAPTNMTARYNAFANLPNGLNLQRLARLEFGGVPRRSGEAMADRSPIYYSRELASAHVPLQIWWSTQDRVVVNQASESGLLYRAIVRLNPHAPVTQFVGIWRHTAEMRATGQMPVALARMGLLHLGATRPQA